jgi:hydrogenase nickel incorporation protein HypA/HybF
MHEWALAEAVISTILNVAKKNNAKKIVEAKIKIGNLQQIDPDILTFAFQELVKNTPLKKTEVKLEPEGANFKCRVCGFEWGFENVMNGLEVNESEAIHFVPDLVHTFIRCPRCNSPDFEVKRGRGVWVEYVTISK